MIGLVAVRVGGGVGWDARHLPPSTRSCATRIGGVGGREELHDRLGVTVVDPVDQHRSRDRKRVV